MPLDFQNVSIDFTNGIARKQNDKLAIPTKLRALYNGEFDADGSVVTRKGADRLFAGTIIGGGTLSAADFFAAYGDEALVGYRDALYSYSPSATKLSPRGRLPHVSLRKKSILRNTATQTNVDGVRDTENGWAAYAWEDSRGGVRYSIHDESTGAVIAYDTVVAASGQMPRVLLTDANLVIVYIDGANLKAAYLGRGRPADPLTSATIASNVHGTVKAMDALVVAADDIYCAYQNTTPALSRVVYRVGSGAGTAANVAVANNLSGIACSMTTDGKVQAWHSQATVGMRALVDSVSGTTITNSVVPTTTDSGTGAASAAQVVAIESATANTATAYYVTATAAPSAVIRSSSITSAGSATGAGEYLLHCQLAGRPFAFGGKNYLPIVFDSAIQGAVFVLELATRSVVARALPLSGVTTTATYVRLGSVATDGASVFSLPVLEKGRLEVKDGDALTTIGLSRLDLTMDRTEALPPVRFADSLFLPGACPMAYDGVSAVELGFNVYPETVTPTSGGAGSVPAGTRYFAAVYEWTDAKGRRHQSAPSLSAAYTNAGATTVSVAVQSLSLTDKYDNSGVSLKPVARTNVNIAVFATEAGGTVFFRSGSVTNNPLAATVTFTHNITDAALIAGEVLYDATNAGTFDAFPPPACRVACVHQNQLVVTGCEDERALFYSRPLADGSGPSFDLARRLRVPEDAGEVAAAATMDSKLAAWTDEATGWFPGDAPNAAGQGAGYGDWQPLSMDVGCVSPQSVIYADGALWFEAEAGLHALGGDGSVVFAGADVADLTVGSIAAVLVPSKKQIYWFQSDGTVLVWDTFWKQWSFIPANSSWGAIAADLRGGRLEWALADGSSRYLTTNATTDYGNVGINLYIETSWLKFAGVQGFQRIRRLHMLGGVDGGSGVNVFLFAFADYDDANTVTLYDGVDFAGPIWRMRHHLGLKCESVRFQLSVTGAGVISLQNLTLEVGVKRGGFKTAQT